MHKCISLTECTLLSFFSAGVLQNTPGHSKEVSLLFSATSPLYMEGRMLRIHIFPKNKIDKNGKKDVTYQ